MGQPVVHFEGVGGGAGNATQAPGTDLAVGHLTDPEGNLVGVAGPAQPT